MPAFLLYRVKAALRPQVAAELKPLGIGLAEFACMRILSKHPGLTSAELARGTDVSAQAANQVLRSLEECGAPAQLTREGKALLKHADAAVRMADQRILARLNADEQLRLKRLLYAGGTDSAH